MEEQFFTEEEYAKYLIRQEGLKRKYERILKRNFNPNGETLTIEEFLNLSRQIKSGDKEAEKTLREKATYCAYDIVKDLYIGGEIAGEFEDALQNTYLIMRKGNIKTFIKYGGKNFTKSLGTYLKKSFDRIEKQYKLGNMDLNGDRCQYEKAAQNVPISAGYSREFTKEAVRKALSTLSSREAGVVRKRYFEKGTLKEVGSDMGVSEERVRQLETMALRKLRHPYSGLYQYFIDCNNEEYQD